jgi:tRNA G18 (ribose-2'-O)-methylase SpoU
MTSFAERGDAPPASAKSAVVADAADLLQLKHRRARAEFLIEGPQGVSEALHAHPTGRHAQVSRVFIAVQAASDFAGIAAAAAAASDKVSHIVFMGDDQTKSFEAGSGFHLPNVTRLPFIQLVFF